MVQVVRHLDRLQVLRDYLRDRVHSDRFDLAETLNYDGVPEEIMPEVGMAGTKSCPMGYATQIPEFESAGFHLDDDYCEFFYREENQLTYTGWKAVEKFFGLTTEEAMELFDTEYQSETYEERNSVAATCERLTKFIQRVQ